jgi:uncharacterized paraquat-inducible protein A
MTTPSIFGTEPRPAVVPQPPTRLPDGRLRCPRCQTSLSAHVPPRCPECGNETERHDHLKLKTIPED